MRKLIFSIILVSGAMIPTVPLPIAGASAEAQEGCIIIQNPDGSGTADCSSQVPAAVAPPPSDSVAVIVPPPQQCQSFRYRVLPDYPPQCSVRGSYVDSEGDRIYVLRCCE